jgi:hypothetical protein
MNRHSIGLFLLAGLAAGNLFGQKGEPAPSAEEIGRLFRIHLLRPEMRSPEDVVTLRELPGGGHVAEISYWRSLKSRDPAEEFCNAVRWVLFGRGVYGKGAETAFEKFPSLQQVSVRLIDLETGTKIGKKRAEIVPTQKTVPYLRVGVFRASLASKRPDWSTVKARLDQGKCADVARTYLDLQWSDPAYFKPVP